MNNRDKRSGFTLLELLVVLAIIAMLTAIVAVRLQAPYQAARLRDALQRIEFIDCQARTHARAFGARNQLVFELDENEIYCLDERDGSRHFATRLPSSLTIDRVVTTQLDAGRGRVGIDVSELGASPTYALCIKTPGGVRQWLLFSGLTGRVVHPEDEIDVQKILELLRSTGPDTY